MTQNLKKSQETKYNQIVGKLKCKGIRMTDIRCSIIEMLIKAEHLTTQEIIKNLENDFDNVNTMSVYNTLDLLLSNHVLFANTFNGKSIYYEIATDKSIHLKCDSCGDIVHISPELTEKYTFGEILKVAQSEGITLDHFKIEAHGMCKKCQIKNIE